MEGHPVHLALCPPGLRAGREEDPPAGLQPLGHRLDHSTLVGRRQVEQNAPRHDPVERRGLERRVLDPLASDGDRGKGGSEARDHLRGTVQPDDLGARPDQEL